MDGDTSSPEAEATFVGYWCCPHCDARWSGTWTGPLEDMTCVVCEKSMNTETVADDPEPRCTCGNGQDSIWHKTDPPCAMLGPGFRDAKETLNSKADKMISHHKELIHEGLGLGPAHVDCDCMDCRPWTS